MPVATGEEQRESLQDVVTRNMRVAMALRGVNQTKLAEALGVDRSAHSLRHRYATRTYESTHDLYLVSKLLGHSSVETTQIYVAMPDSRLRAGMSAVTLQA